MQYQGGKRQIARLLAPVVLQHAAQRPIWEPFVGGANMTPHLRSSLCTDAHPALIGLYRGLQRGWVPPEHVSESEYQTAKNLPDDNPLKGWAGFACSFGAKYFGGYGRCKVDRKHPHPTPQPGTRSQVLKHLGSIKAAFFECVDFLTIPAGKTDFAIYADPPYAGTTGYATGAFDSTKFWHACQLWAAHDVPVLVSEYTCPAPHRILWEHTRDVPLNRKSANRTERLFEVPPC